jgi:hypothetical protein
MTVQRQEGSSHQYNVTSGRVGGSHQEPTGPSSLMGRICQAVSGIFSFLFKMLSSKQGEAPNSLQGRVHELTREDAQALLDFPNQLATRARAEESNAAHGSSPSSENLALPKGLIGEGGSMRGDGVRMFKDGTAIDQTGRTGKITWPNDPNAMGVITWNTEPAAPSPSTPPSIAARAFTAALRALSVQTQIKQGESSLVHSSASERRLGRPMGSYDSIAAQSSSVTTSSPSQGSDTDLQGAIDRKDYKAAIDVINGNKKPLTTAETEQRDDLLFWLGLAALAATKTEPDLRESHMEAVGLAKSLITDPGINDELESYIITPAKLNEDVKGLVLPDNDKITLTLMNQVIDAVKAK